MPIRLVYFIKLPVPAKQLPFYILKKYYVQHVLLAKNTIYSLDEIFDMLIKPNSFQLHIVALFGCICLLSLYLYSFIQIFISIYQGRI